MELQIQNLVSSIRKEGIEAANKEAEAIIAEAKKKADSIVADAKAEAQQHKDASEKEINILRDSAIVNAEQAKRDAVLAFKTEIQGEFEKILAADVRKELYTLDLSGGRLPVFRRRFGFCFPRCHIEASRCFMTDFP